MAPGSAGNNAPLGGLFFDLKSSQISSIFTHSTPGFALMYSIILALTLGLWNEHDEECLLTSQASTAHEDVRQRLDGS